MSKRLCLDKTIDNENSASFSSISIQNIVIQSPSTYPTYTLTLPINTGSAGQVLTTNGSGVLSWSAPTAGVTSVTASSPVVSSGGVTPNISLNTIPTTLGGTGLTTVGTNGQVLTSNGTNLTWQSPTGGTVTSVSASVPSWLSVTVTNPTTTPAITITGSSTGLGTTVVLNETPIIFTPLIRQWLTVYVITPYAGPLGKFLREFADPAVAGEAYRYIELGRYTSDILSGSDSSKFFFYRDGSSQFTGIRYSDKMFRFNGLANFTLPDSEGTNGQILSTNGAGVTSWINNQVGTVTSVSASVPSWLSVTVTNPTTTPAIAITGSATGTGTVSVLQDSPTINNTLTVTDKIAITRNNGNGEAISILNSHSTFPVGNWVSMGYNGNAANQAHFGFWSLSNGSGYAYIQTNGNRNFVVDNDGRIGVRVTNPTVTVDVYDSPAVLRLTSANQNPTTMILTDTTNTNVAKITMTLLSSTDVLARTFQIFRGTGGSGTDYIFSANVSNQVSIGTPTSNSNAKFEVLSLVSSTSDDLVASFASLNTTSRVRVDISKNFSSTNGGFLYYDVAATGIIGLGHSTGGKLLQFDKTGLLTVDKVKAGSTTILGAGTYTITLPPTAGTNGQVLTTNGSGTLSWTTPTTGTVTSVSATSPLASSGGATPTISIASSTGTGAVVLENYPVITGGLSLAQLTPINSNIGEIFTNSAQSYTIGIRGDTSNVFAITDNTAGAFRMVINTSGNVGIGTTSPTQKLDVVGSVKATVFSPTGSCGFISENSDRTWTAGIRGDIGDSYNIVDETAAVGRLTINSLGNVGIGTLLPSYKLHVVGAGYFNYDGENLVLDGVTHSYIRFQVSGVNYAFLGFPNIGTQDISLYNQRSTGHIFLDMANTNGRVRSVKPILLQEAVTLKIAPSSGTFDFILPASAGTAGQYLISGGPGAAMYWGTGGGGGGGTVNSVTASSPLASSGGTSPNISISSATGTGAVVLATSPTFVTSNEIASNPPGQGLLRFTAVANAAYIQCGLAASTGSSADLIFGNINDVNRWMTLKSTGNLGIGTTTPAAKLDVNGAVYSNAESHFSNGTYSDPDSGTSYTAKFGTTSGNGIAVKGNSKFTNSVIAANFTTNSSDFFTYATAYSLSALQMVGTNLNAGTYGYDAVAAAGGLITITARESKLVRIGDSVTVNFYIEFTYSSNPVPSYPYMCILLTNSNTNGFRNPTSSAVTLYSQAVCNYPTSITGISNPITATVVNVTYAGGAYVGLLITTTNGFVQYNPSFGQSNQKISGGVTYNLF